MTFIPEELSLEIYTENPEDLGTYHFYIEAYIAGVLVHDLQGFSLLISEAVNNQPYWEQIIDD